jgi:hypothetical protein
MAVDGAAVQHILTVDFTKADWVTAIAAVIALGISVIGLFIAASARRAAINANKISQEANDIANRAAKNTESLEKKLLRAGHELEEFRKNFSNPIVQLIGDVDLMIDELEVRRRKNSNHAKAVRSFETDVWEALHRRVKAFIIRSIEAKFISETLFQEIENLPDNPVDSIFEAIDELARSNRNSERASRAIEKLAAATKVLTRKLTFEKEACSERLYEKLGLN